MIIIDYTYTFITKTAEVENLERCTPGRFLG